MIICSLLKVVISCFIAKNINFVINSYELNEALC